MASNNNINDIANYLNQFNQQQNTPQYQITPEQVQAYANILNLQNQQQDLRQDDIARLQQARQKDALINTVGNIANSIGNAVGNRQGNEMDLIFRDYRGNVIGQLAGRKPTTGTTPTKPTTQFTDTAKQQIALQEQARQQEVANAQQMAKFQDALAIANQYGIPIGQAMELTGKDILGYKEAEQTAQAGITKEQIDTAGNLYNTILKGEQDYQLADFEAKNDLNLQQNKYLNEGLLKIQQGNIDRGIEEMKQAGLDKRQQAELLNRMNIAKTQANATTTAAATRARATIDAANARAEAEKALYDYKLQNPIQNSSTMNAWINQYWALPPEQQQQLIKANPQIFGLIQQMGNTPNNGDAFIQ